jgi:hypothetical protein
MLMHYHAHKDPGPAGFLDESSVGMLIASHLVEKLPRFLDFMKAAEALQRYPDDTPKGVIALGRSHALLSASTASREQASGLSELVRSCLCLLICFLLSRFQMHSSRCTWDLEFLVFFVVASISYDRSVLVPKIDVSAVL